MKKNTELKTRLDRIIEKSNTQNKILKKILTQLSKQNEDLEDHSKNSHTEKK